MARTMTPTPNFDRVARIYRWAEYLSLGPFLHQTRTHFLSQLPALQQALRVECREALVLGDGDGRFLATLLAQQTQLHALAIDTSRSMLALLRRRCIPYGDRLRTQQTSALDLFDHLNPNFRADLIVTHFFLDCLTQPEVDRLAHHLAAHTSPGALWMHSDFAIPSHRLLAPLAALYVRLLYLAFRILTGLRVTRLPDPHSALAAAGFQRIARHSLLCGLLYTEVWQCQESGPAVKESRPAVVDPPALQRTPPVPPLPPFPFPASGELF